MTLWEELPEIAAIHSNFRHAAMADVMTPQQRSCCMAAINGKNCNSYIANHM